jgi:hypothetical protein
MSMAMQRMTARFCGVAIDDGVALRQRYDGNAKRAALIARLLQHRSTWVPSGCAA